ncbi:MAG: cytochrome c biogenesis protein CcsA [Leptospirales bacterium]|nr:cytochrome c biogenesis protein CcsA [Leptospirales bacterium]
MMNSFGAIVLVAAAAVCLLGLFLSSLSLNLKTARNLTRSIVLEWIDAVQGVRGRRRLAARFARLALKLLGGLQRGVLQGIGLNYQLRALALARQCFYSYAALLALAFFTLMTMMVAVDLSNHYVVTHSASDLPLFFRLTAAWAGSSGSLLFWNMLLAFFSAVAVYQWRHNDRSSPPLLLSLGLLQLIFAILSVYFDDAQPFRSYGGAMAAGRGLNPLLLHWAMIIHPPILYVGYVSFAIPFALTMGALLSRSLKQDWTPAVRRWTIFSWFFLGTGILLGSKWAYEELGWGGYWAWDPVENASLMPWLLATAFLHSLLVQDRRGMLRFWNIVLLTLTYHMCLLGTWITRSGILQGPHTFAESSIGKPLIIYIGLSFLFYLRYVYFMRRQLRPDQAMEAITSKEGSMLLNNFLMSLATLIVLVGVFSPLLPIDCSFDHGFVCNKVEWKQSAFNKVMVPLGLFTLFLMGASPLLSWRKDAWSVWKRTLRWPLLAGIVAASLFGASYGLLFTRGENADASSWGPGVVAEIFSILTVGIAVFVFWGLAQEFWQGARSRIARFQENPFRALALLTLRNKRRYGGYLAHLAIVFLFVGYSGGSFKQTDKFEFHYVRMPYEEGSGLVRYYSGDKAYLDAYEIEARDLFLHPVWKDNADHSSARDFTIGQQAHYLVREQGEPRLPEVPREGESSFDFANRQHSRAARLIKVLSGIVVDGRMSTERQFHPQIDPASGDVVREGERALHQPTSKPDIRSAWNQDLYIQLGAIFDPASGRNPDLNHAYEVFFFHPMGKNELAEDLLFPRRITATLEVWINPLVKFIWLGSLLFFFSGLLIVLPFGEKERHPS